MKNNCTVSVASKQADNTIIICEHLLKISDHQNGKLREPRVRGTRLVSDVTPRRGYSMIKDTTSNIKDSLAKISGKIEYVETENCRLTRRLTEDSAWLVSLLALHSIRGQLA